MPSPVDRPAIYSSATAEVWMGPTTREAAIVSFTTWLPQDIVTRCRR